MDVPILQIDDLTSTFYTERGTVKAVDNVSLSLQKGEVLGLVGESGSGKSTIALSILGLLANNGKVTKGSILLKGNNLLAKSEAELRQIRGSQISMVFQDPLSSLNPSLRVGDQIAEMFVVHQKFSKKDAWEGAIRLLEKMGIPDSSHKALDYPHLFSGGMQQRVLIAISLACNPSLVILDEPTTALDVTIEAEIIHLLKQLQEEFRVAMLYITHNLGIVTKICDKVSVLYAGQMVELAPTEDLFKKQLHPYTKGLLASIPHLDMIGRRGRLSPISGSFPSLISPPDGCIFHPRCPFVMPACKKEPPPMIDAGGEHKTRCWRYKEICEMEWPLLPSTEPSLSRNCDERELISIVNLSKIYQVKRLWSEIRFRPREWPPFSVGKKNLHAVDNVSLSIKNKETFGLVGESGCGKTTLGRCLVRLLNPTNGRIFFEGENLTNLSMSALKTYRKDIQIIFQNPDSSLNPRKTIGQIIGRPLELFGIADGSKRGIRISELLQTVQLPESYKNRYPHELSGGEKQRVGIARALSFNPKFIVCDEPVTALDVSVQASILNLLADLQDRFDLSYLFIAHDLSVIAHISDRVGVMYRGRLCEVGEVEEVFQPPYHPYTHALLSAIPIPDYSQSQKPWIRLRGTNTLVTEAPPGCIFEERCPVKIGEICEIEKPPERRANDHHFIACHKPLEELEAFECIVSLKVKPLERN